MILELCYNSELGPVIDRNKDTRCIAICIAIPVFHIAIRFLAYRRTPTMQCTKRSNQDPLCFPLKIHSCSAVRNVSDCRSSGREFDPSLIPYFGGD